MTAIETAWQPEYTAAAERIWAEYQQGHDLTAQVGKVAAIEPLTGRVWIGDSGADVAEQMEAAGVEAPVYLVRIGFDHYVRKGRR